MFLAVFPDRLALSGNALVGLGKALEPNPALLAMTALSSGFWLFVVVAPIAIAFDRRGYTNLWAAVSAGAVLWGVRSRFTYLIFDDAGTPGGLLAKALGCEFVESSDEYRTRTIEPTCEELHGFAERLRNPYQELCLAF